MNLLNGILFVLFAVAARTEKLSVHKFNGDRRIFDGKPALKSYYPYQAGILFTPANAGTTGKKDLCGGSLISSTRVLTAAHCAIDTISAYVVLGAINLFEYDPIQYRVTVPASGIVCHPKYDPDTLHNDIAMIKLPSAVKFNNNISPIALAEGTDDFVGDTGITSGWGDYDKTEKTSTFLRFVNLKVITNSKCSLVFEDINDSIICARGNGNDAGCDGDSG